MSTPAATRSPQVGLLDIGWWQAEWSRKARRNTVLEFVFIGVFVSTQSFFAWNAFGFTWQGWSLVALAVALYAGLFGGTHLWGRRRDRLIGGPASPGPSSLGSVTTLATGPQVWAAVNDTLAREGFSGGRLLDPYTMDAGRWPNRGARTFVLIRVQGMEDGRGRVSVWARTDQRWGSGRPRDFGHSRQIANALLRAIPESTPADWAP